MYWIGKPGQMYGMKLNANCSKEEKNGEGPGSCGGKVPEKNPDNGKQFLGMSKIEKDRGERLDLPNYTKGPWLTALGETKLPPDDKGYYYHATTSDRLDSIIDIGLKAGISKPNFPSEINKHMNEVFLSKRLNDIPGEPYGAEYWSRMIFRSNKNKPIILRVKESSLKNVKKYGNEYEYRTKDSISSDNLEILKYGRWIPLIDIKSKLHQKLNYNCPDSEKSGKGKGSCGGSKKSDKKDSGKSASKVDIPKASTMNARDIISRVQSGGKITKEEHAYITALMNGEKPKASEPVSKPVPVSTAIQKVPKKELVTNTKKAVEKVKSEMKAGKVSQKSVNELKKATTELKEAKTSKPKVSKADKAKLKSENAIAVKAALNSTEQLWTTLNENQQKAIEHFSSVDYVPINSYLRTGKVENYDSSYVLDTKEVKDRIKQMDSVFDKVELPENTTVYRGINMELLEKMKDQLIPGNTLEFSAFTSTTHDENVAKTFARGSKNAIFEIRLPKGSKALSIENHSGFKKESEILLNRGMKFKVVEVKTKNIHGGAFSNTRIILEAY